MPCVEPESNLHSECGWIMAAWACRCPADTIVAVPWMGFEPMLSTVRAWRPLRAGPPGHVRVAQGGVEPPASLHLREGGLPVAYRASRPPPCQRTVAARGGPARVSGGSRTRLPGLEDRRLGRSATDTSGSAEGEGVEPSRLIARPGSSRVPSPVGLPFRCQSGWLDLNQRGPASEAGG